MLGKGPCKQDTLFVLNYIQSAVVVFLITNLQIVWLNNNKLHAWDLEILDRVHFICTFIGDDERTKYY